MVGTTMQQWTLPVIHVLVIVFVAILALDALILIIGATLYQSVKRSRMLRKKLRDRKEVKKFADGLDETIMKLLDDRSDSRPTKPYDQNGEKG